MFPSKQKHQPSLAEKCGYILLLLAAILFIVGPYLAILPLSLFLLLCFTAPFLPNFSFFLPIISKAKKGESGIAITFDDGPDPSSTPVVLDLLARYDLQATFFVVGTRAARYPELVQSILEHGHTIGNHSWDHDYYLMFRSIGRLRRNIQKTQEILRQLGVETRVFRPPMGITGSRLGIVLRMEGLTAVNYSCRALDRGNRNIDNLAAKILGKLQAGDIIMLHDLPLATPEQSIYWQNELNLLFAQLQRSYNTISLDNILGHAVMIRLNKKSPHQRGISY